MIRTVITTRRWHAKPVRPQAGLTLLEMLVALAIVAMIATMLASSLSVAFRARRSAMNNLDQVRQARLAMEMIGRDFIMAVPPTGILAGAFTATPQQGGADLDSVTFFNTGPVGPTVPGGADVQKVELAVLSEAELHITPAEPDTVDPRDNGPRLAPENEGQLTGFGQDRVLVRRVTRRLLAQVTVEPANQVIVRQVRAFRLRYYDGSDWLDTWDSTTTDNTLPLAVEVTLQIERSASAASRQANPEPYTLVRVFAIPTAVSAEEMAQTTPSSSAVGGGSIGGGGSAGGGGARGGGSGGRGSSARGRATP